MAPERYSSRKLSQETNSSVHDAKRALRWTFPRIGTLRRDLLQWAGRLIWPQDKLTLSMSINQAVKSRIEAALHILEATT